MDGWWNNDQNPDGAQEQNNPFARVPAADHVPQPDIPAAQPLQPNSAMDGMQQPAQLFSQIRQGDPYGYAAPEAVPAPAFSGDMQNPFGNTIGAVPFGNDMPAPAGGSFSGFSGDFPAMPFPPMGDAGAFTPPSYAGFPPLMGNAAWQTGNTAPMPPADAAWQTGNTAPMPPVDAAWQTGNTAPMPTLRWDPSADLSQWQTPADPAALSAQTQRWQPEAPQPWEAPLVNVRTEQTSFLDDPALSLPEYPEARADWTPPESDAPITPEFMKDWAENEKTADPDERLNIPVYLRKRPLPAKRPVPRKKPVQEADAAQEAAKADSESTVEATPVADETVPAATTVPAVQTVMAEGETVAPTEDSIPASAEDAPAGETAEEPSPIDEAPAAEAPAAPQATAEDTSASGAQGEETNPNARFMRPAVYVPLGGEAAGAEKPEAAPKRRSRMERHAVLQPAALDADALKPRRRSHHTDTATPAPTETPAADKTTDEEGNNRPFVPAAVAEDSRVEALPARPQSEAVTPDAADAALTPAAEPTGSSNAWPSLTDPDFAADDSYRYRQLFGHQPLYGDLMNRPAAQPLPGPAADDPSVPWVKPAEPTPLPTDDAIHAAAMEDTAREAAAVQAAPNPYAAAFPVPPAADPAGSGDDDFLMDELPVYEEPLSPSRLSGSDPCAPAQPADSGEPLPEPDVPSGKAAPAAQTASDAFVPDEQPVWEDDLFSAGSMPDPKPPKGTDAVLDPPADPIPGFPPVGAPYSSATGQESDPVRFPDLPPAPGAAWEDPPLGGDAPADIGSFGTSSYDAGDMPNPTRGHMPYEVVSAFDTDSRRRAELAAELAAAQATAQARQPSAAPPQPEAVKPPKQPKPQKPPIKPFRVVLLLAAAAMVVYIVVAGSRLITSYVQNTEEWSSFYNSFRADNGTDVNHAGETVQLRSDGSTFPPAPGSALSPAATPPPGTTGAQGAAQTEASERTRQTRYADNELRNIREDMAEIRKEYPEVMGRLEIPGVLDEWVVQRNNTYYLNHNYRGTAEEGGAVFMDSACTLFTPPENLHLRGSDSAPGKTFHPLWQYKTGGAAFVTGAAQATVTTIYEKADYLLVAVFEASMDPTRPNYFNYTSYPTFASDAEMMDYIAKVRQRSLYALPTDVLPGDRLLTLSTVSNTPSEDEKPVCLVLIFRHRPATPY